MFKNTKWFSFWEGTDTLNEREITQTTSALLKTCKSANAEELQQSNLKNAAGRCTEGHGIPWTLSFPILLSVSCRTLKGCVRGSSMLERTNLLNSWWYICKRKIFGIPLRKIGATCFSSVVKKEKVEQYPPKNGERLIITEGVHNAEGGKYLQKKICTITEIKPHIISMCLYLDLTLETTSNSKLTWEIKGNLVAWRKEMCKWMTSQVSGKTGKIFICYLCKSYEPMTDESFSDFLFSKKACTLFSIPTVPTQKTQLTLLTKWEESLLQNNLLTYGEWWKQMLPRSKQTEHLKWIIWKLSICRWIWPN